MLNYEITSVDELLGFSSIFPDHSRSSRGCDSSCSAPDLRQGDSQQNGVLLRHSLLFLLPLHSSSSVQDKQVLLCDKYHLHRFTGVIHRFLIVCPDFCPISIAPQDSGIFPGPVPRSRAPQRPATAPKTAAPQLSSSSTVHPSTVSVCGSKTNQSPGPLPRTNPGQARGCTQTQVSDQPTAEESPASPREFVKSNAPCKREWKIKQLSVYGE